MSRPAAEPRTALLSSDRRETAAAIAANARVGDGAPLGKITGRQFGELASRSRSGAGDRPNHQFRVPGLMGAVEVPAGGWSAGAGCGR
jgi:hypothetical protein